MTIGSSNRTALRRVKETVFGEIPSTPTLQDIRYTGEGINYSINNVTSNEIRSDRQTADLVQVGSDVAGNIDFELSYGSFDDLIQAVLFAGSPTVVNMDDVSTIGVTAASNEFTDSGSGFVTAGIVVGMWIKTSGFANAGNNGFFRVTAVAAGTITVEDPNNTLTDEAAGNAVDIVASMWRNGVTSESFTFQKHIQDIATPSFLNYVGCKLGQMSMEVATDSILTGSFEVMGLNAQDPSDNQIAGATVQTVGSNTPMNAVNNVVNVLEDGAATPRRFSSISLTVNNNLRAVDAVASLPHIDIRAGRLSVTGALNIYYEDKTAYEKFTAGSYFSFSFRVQDANGNAYIFTFPRVKFSTGSLVSGGLDTDLVFETEFTAIVDPTTGCMIQVDKFDA